MNDVGIDLDETSRSIIELEVAAGRFAKPSDVVRSALLLLREREEELAELRQAIDEGDHSGDPLPMDFAAYVAGKLGASSSPR